MKKRVSQCIVGLLCIVFFSAGFAGAENTLEYDTTQLVIKLHRYFPNVTGAVVSVQEENVFIDLGIEHDIVIGAQLAILQEGVEIVHPTTGKVLGTYQKLSGALQVTEVREQFSVARLIWIEADTEITPGMSVGGIPGRVKVGMLPATHSENRTREHLAMQQALAQALRADDRFTVFDEADLQAAALKAGVVAENVDWEQNLAAINDILQAHNFLRSTIRPEAESVFMQAVLLSPQGEEIGSVQEIIEKGVQETVALNQAASSPTPAPPEPAVSAESDVVSPTPPTEKASIPPSSPQTVTPQQQPQQTYWKSDLLRMKAHKIAVGDVTGDGKNEVVLTSHSEIEIYEHGKLGEKDSFHLLGRIEGFTNATILSLGIADINGNGRGEIFLTTLQTISSDARVFEYIDGRFQEIWSNKGLVLRVLSRPLAGPLLIGQKSTSSLVFEFLSGKVYAYTWNGKEYASQEALHIPARMDVFGLALADVNGDGVEESLWYDRFDRINLFRGKTLVWRSRSYEPYVMNVIREGEEDTVQRRIHGKLELTKIAADNEMRLIAIHNLRAFKILRGLPSYSGSEFLIFRWDGEKFVEEFTSEEFEGYLPDYAVGDVDNDGQPEIVLAMILRGDSYFRTPQSQILVYEIQ